MDIWFFLCLYMKKKEYRSMNMSFHDSFFYLHDFPENHHPPNQALHQIATRYSTFSMAIWQIHLRVTVVIFRQLLRRPEWLTINRCSEQRTRISTSSAFAQGRSTIWQNLCFLWAAMTFAAQIRMDSRLISGPSFTLHRFALMDVSCRQMEWPGFCCSPSCKDKSAKSSLICMVAYESLV